MSASYPVGGSSLAGAVLDRLLRRANILIGRPWRRYYRPYSGGVTDRLRILRFAKSFYRFDEFGTAIVFGRGVRFWGPMKICIGDHVAILDQVIFSGTGEIRIGDRSSIGHDSVIVSRELVDIGNDVMIAAHCYVLDVDHGYSNEEKPMAAQALHIDPVRVGDDVWIGAHTVILRGVTIGSGAIIGAHSLVRRDVEPNSIVAGVPARVIGHRGLSADYSR